MNTSGLKRRRYNPKFNILTPPMSFGVNTRGSCYMNGMLLLDREMLEQRTGIVDSRAKLQLLATTQISSTVRRKTRNAGLRARNWKLLGLDAGLTKMGFGTSIFLFRLAWHLACGFRKVDEGRTSNLPDAWNLVFNACSVGSFDIPPHHLRYPLQVSNKSRS